MTWGRDHLQVPEERTRTLFLGPLRQACDGSPESLTRLVRPKGQVGLATGRNQESLAESRVCSRSAEWILLAIEKGRTL